MNHGTVTTYVSKGCRCDRCRRAAADYYRAARERFRTERVLVDGRLVAPGHPSQHGTANWYFRRGCRCQVCTAAVSERRSAQRAARRSAS